MTLDPNNPIAPRLLSHPAENGREAVELERHLLGVAERARSVTPESARTVGHVNDVEGSLGEAVEIVGLAHDFGKASTWFQQHIGTIPGKPNGDPTHHSRLGSLVAYYALRDRGFAPTTRFAGFVAVAKHHGNLPEARAFLETFEAEEQWSAGSSGYNRQAAEQAKNIDRHNPEFATAMFNELCHDGSWADFRDRLVATVDLEDDTLAYDTPKGERQTLRELFLTDFYRVNRRRRKPKSRITCADAYIDELRLFGALTFADKTQAAGIQDDDARLHAAPLMAEKTRSYIDGLDGTNDEPKASLNELRSEIQNRVFGGCGVDPIREFVATGRNVATLSLPTGYGKTLTGLLAAARIRELTGGERIVYALPFTSIVDQTAEVLADVTGKSETGRAFSIHHHLAETVTLAREDRSLGNEDETDERAPEDVMLAKSWLAGVTLTTFVQLFESIAGPRNGQSMKLPALYDSVVVLDEPQALPLRWWPLVQRTLRMLVTEFDATVLLMTATQPQLLKAPEPFELLPRDELTALERDHFERVPERVEYLFDSSVLGSGGETDVPVSYDVGARRLVDDVVDGTESVLAICNTIDSARELFQEVTNGLEALTDEPPVDAGWEYEKLLAGIGAPPTTDQSDELSFARRAFTRYLACECEPNRPVILHLTTRVRPCDRRFLLAIADDLTRMDVPFVLVSTQLIEAGVDVSFDRVYRDFAPLDSIVQAAGRCNRSFERAPETGTVTVWRLEAPSGIDTSPSKAVYGRALESTEMDLLDLTQRVLNDHVDGITADETTVAREAVESFHDSVGRTVGALAPDNNLLQYFEQANARALRRESLIDRVLSYEVYVCRTKAELADARAVKALLATGEYEEVKEIRDKLAPIRVSIPVYRSNSEAARELHNGLECFTDDREDAERILDATEETDFFDASMGVQPLESGVEDRFF